MKGTNYALIPPIKGLLTPRIVRVSELFSEKDVKAREVDAFPILAPFFAAAKCHVDLEKIDY